MTKSLANKTTCPPTDVSPSYYRKPIQPIEYAMLNGLGHCEATVLKYITRWKEKGGVTDLRKARQYIDFLIDDAEERPEQYSLESG